MQGQIRHTNPGAEFWAEEGCHILESWNDESDDAVSVARARVSGGVTTQWHRLRETVERYLIIEGMGRVEVGDLAPTDVGPGDVVIIPAGQRQRITNTGEIDLLFYCICTPRFRKEDYEAVE